MLLLEVLIKGIGKAIYILTVLFVLFVLFGIAKSEPVYYNKEYTIIRELQKINKEYIDNAIYDVCMYSIIEDNKKNCFNILKKDKKLYHNIKYILYGIAFKESSFYYKTGKLDKNDISYYQINISHFPIEKIRKLTSLNIWTWNVKHQVDIATFVAIRVYLYNYLYYKCKGKHLSSLHHIGDYSAIWNNPTKINKTYSKIVYNFIKNNYYKLNIIKVRYDR